MFILLFLFGTMKLLWEEAWARHLENESLPGTQVICLLWGTLRPVCQPASLQSVWVRPSQTTQTQPRNFKTHEIREKSKYILHNWLNLKWLVAWKNQTGILIYIKSYDLVFFALDIKSFVLWFQLFMDICFNGYIIKLAYKINILSFDI